MLRWSHHTWGHQPPPPTDACALADRACPAHHCSWTCMIMSSFALHDGCSHFRGCVVSKAGHVGCASRSWTQEPEVCCRRDMHKTRQCPGIIDLAPVCGYSCCPEAKDFHTNTVKEDQHPMRNPCVCVAFHSWHPKFNIHGTRHQTVMAVMRHSFLEFISTREYCDTIKTSWTDCHVLNHNNQRLICKPETPAQMSNSVERWFWERDLHWISIFQVCVIPPHNSKLVHSTPSNQESCHTKVLPKKNLNRAIACYASAAVTASSKHMSPVVTHHRHNKYILNFGDTGWS